MLMNFEISNPIKKVDLNSLTPIFFNNIKLIIPPQVYTPKEDTELIMKFLDERIKILSQYPLKKYRVLEMGCGSGIISLYLIKLFRSYQIDFFHIGIDINPIAIETSKKNSLLNKFDSYTNFIFGSFFTPLITNNQKLPYDLIIFNPPYLASELEIINDSNRKLIDLSWEGGLHGYEVTLEFLNQISQFTKKDGELILISSNLINQEPILAKIQENDMEIIEKKIIHIAYEDIILYHGKKKKNKEISCEN